MGQCWHSGRTIFPIRTVEYKTKNAQNGAQECFFQRSCDSSSGKRSLLISWSQAHDANQLLEIHVTKRSGSAVLDVSQNSGSSSLDETHIAHCSAHKCCRRAGNLFSQSLNDLVLCIPRIHAQDGASQALGTSAWLFPTYRDAPLGLLGCISINGKRRDFPAYQDMPQKSRWASYQNSCYSPFAKSILKFCSEHSWFSMENQQKFLRKLLSYHCASTAPLYLLCCYHLFFPRVTSL